MRIPKIRNKRVSKSESRRDDWIVAQGFNPG